VHARHEVEPDTLLADDDLDVVRRTGRALGLGVRELELVGRELVEQVEASLLEDLQW